MLELLLEPFSYDYMFKAIVVSGAIGAVCAFLSAYLMLKGWSLIGDALSHAVVPGVALAYALSLPYAVGAFFSGFLATIAILAVKSVTKLREDAVIGFIFTTFFALGLLIISINPTSVNVQSIILGNILGIADEDMLQVVIILSVSLFFLVIYWKDLLLVFFDEIQAKAVGISPMRLKVLFFSLLSACIVAALQSVGAILVIAMVVTPGATAYLLTDKFGKLLIIAISLGGFSGFFGTYLSYFADGATGGFIVTLQTLLFLLAFFFAPKYGLLSRKFAKNPAKLTACQGGE
ncbi:metal ABC transporter permease [Glaesserella parasuis]|uniref:metal ABC transporter permease n=1 Tax=Glaesserella parasuis TaxID=738 RepID=UPI0024368F7A|nr:metal ABC transporter permease [Glaesserella parasuis]MDG6454599.1 metal ABC transporter permease [Glaesserella parasuis]